jgi:hypothetical protein
MFTNSFDLNTLFHLIDFSEIGFFRFPQHGRCFFDIGYRACYLCMQRDEVPRKNHGNDYLFICPDAFHFITDFYYANSLKIPITRMSNKKL